MGNRSSSVGPAAAAAPVSIPSQNLTCRNPQSSSRTPPGGRITSRDNSALAAFRLLSKIPEARDIAAEVASDGNVFAAVWESLNDNPNFQNLVEMLERREGLRGSTADVAGSNQRPSTLNMDPTSSQPSANARSQEDAGICRGTDHPVKLSFTKERTMEDDLKLRQEILDLTERIYLSSQSMRARATSSNHVNNHAMVAYRLMTERPEAQEVVAQVVSDCNVFAAIWEKLQEIPGFRNDVDIVKRMKEVAMSYLLPPDDVDLAEEDEI